MMSQFLRARKVERQSYREKLKQEAEEMSLALELRDRLERTEERLGALEGALEELRREMWAQIDGYREIFERIMKSNGHEESGY
jgi:HAMP domain-containing protein